MSDIKPENLHCPLCKTKFSLCKTWEKGLWKYYCFAKGCNYAKWKKPTRDEEEIFNS